MRNLLLLCFSLISFIAVAQPARQDTTEVFSRPGYDRDPIRARLKRVVEKKDSLWVVSLMLKKNVIFERISFADEELSIRKGPYALYENGKVYQQGTYDKGYKHGIWNEYSADGQLLSTLSYRWDQLYGPYDRFWENGIPKEKGTYLNGKLVSKRFLFYRDGKKAAEEIYDDKGLTSATYFTEDGKVVDKLPSFN